LQELLLGEIDDQPRELVERELPPDRRSDRQGLVARPGEAVEPPPDRVTHALRDPRAPALRRAEGLGRQRPLIRQEPDDLADEERISLGLGVDGANESLAGRKRAGGLDEAFDVLV